MIVSDKEKEFLIGLEKLTRETGVAIGGCGCCSSPYLLDGHDSDSKLDDRAGYGFAHGDQVAWIDPNDQYDWENFSATIVK